MFFLIAKYVVEVIIISIFYKYFCFSVKEVSASFLKVVFSIGIPTAIMNLLISVNYSIDVLMLNVMGSSDVQIGIYGLAYSLSNMLWIVPDAFKEAVYNKSVKSDDYRFIFKCFVINIAICAAILVCFIFLGKFFLDIVYGEEYVVSYETILVLFAGVIPMIAFKLIHPIYVNSGKSLLVAILLIIAVVANVVASIFLIPSHGALGAAIATVISYTICGIMFLFKFCYDFFWKKRNNDVETIK